MLNITVAPFGSPDVQEFKTVLESLQGGSSMRRCRNFSSPSDKTELMVWCLNEAGNQSPNDSIINNTLYLLSTLLCASAGGCFGKRAAAARRGRVHFPDEGRPATAPRRPFWPVYWQARGASRPVGDSPGFRGVSCGRRPSHAPHPSPHLHPER